MIFSARTKRSYSRLTTAWHSDTPPKGSKVDLDNQPLPMTTRVLALQTLFHTSQHATGLDVQHRSTPIGLRRQVTWPPVNRGRRFFLLCTLLHRPAWTEADNPCKDGSRPKGRNAVRASSTKESALGVQFRCRQRCECRRQVGKLSLFLLVAIDDDYRSRFRAFFLAHPTQTASCEHRILKKATKWDGGDKLAGER